MASGTKDEKKPDIDRKRLERALKHPLRETMLDRLNGGSMEPSELAALLGKEPRLIAYHYRVLGVAGGLPGRDTPE